MDDKISDISKFRLLEFFLITEILDEALRIWSPFHEAVYDRTNS